MDRTQLTASIAGLGLVAASIVGAVVATQGPSDVVVSNESPADNQAVLATELSPAGHVVDMVSANQTVEGDALPAEAQFAYDDEAYEEAENEDEAYEEEAGYEEEDEYEEGEDDD